MLLRKIRSSTEEKRHYSDPYLSPLPIYNSQRGHTLIFAQTAKRRYQSSIMAADKRLNDLLRWSIENQDTTSAGGQPQQPAGQASNLTPDVMAALMGGPSDADLMKASMEIIVVNDPEVSLDDKLIAFDNFEQLIENLDNANNMANLGLWSPLLKQLGHEEADVRKMAAWCVGTAVQNNEKTQERLHSEGGIPTLVELATGTSQPEAVRRKAVYALSSACRNYQPGMDACLVELRKSGAHSHDGAVDAADMEAVDAIMTPLREKAKSG